MERRGVISDPEPKCPSEGNKEDYKEVFESAYSTKRRWYAASNIKDSRKD